MPALCINNFSDSDTGNNLSEMSLFGNLRMIHKEPSEKRYQIYLDIYVLNKLLEHGISQKGQNPLHDYSSAFERNKKALKKVTKQTFGKTVDFNIFSVEPLPSRPTECSPPCLALLDAAILGDEAEFFTALKSVPLHFVLENSYIYIWVKLFLNIHDKNYRAAAQIADSLLSIMMMRSSAIISMLVITEMIQAKLFNDEIPSLMRFGKTVTAGSQSFFAVPFVVSSDECNYHARINDVKYYYGPSQEQLNKDTQLAWDVATTRTAHSTTISYPAYFMAQTAVSISHATQLFTDMLAGAVMGVVNALRRGKWTLLGSGNKCTKIKVRNSRDMLTPGIRGYILFDTEESYLNRNDAGDYTDKYIALYFPVGEKVYGLLPDTEPLSEEVKILLAQEQFCLSTV